MVRFSHMGEGRGKQRFSNQTFGFIYLGNEDMEELDHHFWVDLDLNLEGLFAAKTTLSISPEWWKSHLMHESFGASHCSPVFFWCNQGPWSLQNTTGPQPSPRFERGDLTYVTNRKSSCHMWPQWFGQCLGWEWPYGVWWWCAFLWVALRGAETVWVQISSSNSCRSWVEGFQDPTARVKKTPGVGWTKSARNISGFLALKFGLWPGQPARSSCLRVVKWRNWFSRKFRMDVVRSF